MIYYLDCEFDGYGGKLISIGIASLNHTTFYAVLDLYALTPPSIDLLACTDWVYENVIPNLWPAPEFAETTEEYGTQPVSGSYAYKSITRKGLSKALEKYFHGDKEIYIVADWPDDIKYLCELLMTGPGTMIDIPSIAFGIRRVDAYPTEIPGAIQHNAMWDAIALAEYHNPGYWKGPVS
jgi:hypothetical protein